MTEYTDCCECLTEDKVVQPQPDNIWLLGLGLLALVFIVEKEK